MLRPLSSNALSANDPVTAAVLRQWQQDEEHSRLPCAPPPSADSISDGSPSGSVMWFKGGTPAKRRSGDGTLDAPLAPDFFFDRFHG